MNTGEMLQVRKKLISFNTAKSQKLGLSLLEKLLIWNTDKPLPSPRFHHPPDFRYSRWVVFCLGIFINRQHHPHPHGENLGISFTPTPRIPKAIGCSTFWTTDFTPTPTGITPPLVQKVEQLVEGNIIPTDTSPTIRSAMGIPIASPPRVSLLNRRIDPTLTLGGRQHHPHGYPRRSKLYLVTGYHSPTLSPLSPTLSPLISPNSPILISVD